MYQDTGSDRVNIHMECSCACMLVCMCACVYMYIYIYIYCFFFGFFVWYCLDTKILTGSLPSLSLETPDIKRNI